jgi:uncharacterized protein with PIN domain
MPSRSPFRITLNFHGDLSYFLRPKKSQVERQLNEKTAVKDVIEACGVPHTEVDLILIGGRAADFGDCLLQDAVVDLYGIDYERSTFFVEHRLQVRHITRFVADGHLGKLVRDLRLLGIDVLCDPFAKDPQLVATAAIQQRALLTRDRRLLMHSAVRHGYYLRSQRPLEQTMEVLHRFDLDRACAPFSRCLRCNASLHRVDKNQVMDRLEPLTRQHYQHFRRCSGCGQVYWSGSHFDKLRDRIEKLRASIQIDAKLT